MRHKIESLRKHQGKLLSFSTGRRRNTQHKQFEIQSPRAKSLRIKFFPRRRRTKQTEQMDIRSHRSKTFGKSIKFWITLRSILVFRIIFPHFSDIDFLISFFRSFSNFWCHFRRRRGPTGDLPGPFSAPTATLNWICVHGPSRDRIFRELWA